MKKQNINEKIRAKEVRLIGPEGENLDIKPIEEALKIARDADMDLVEVSAGANPPVCRILDHNKYLYEQKTKAKKSKAKKTDLKEFKFGPNIGEGDLRQRIERGKTFLNEGNMVKYTVQFRGRQNAHPEIGETKLKIVESELSEVSKIEKPAKKSGSFLSMTLRPA